MFRDLFGGVLTMAENGPSEKRYDTDQPWIVWRFLSTDRETRVTGRSRVEMQCAVCGHKEVLRIKIPRFGPVPIPKGGKHAKRLRFMLDHLHRDKPHPMAWALPLLNPFGQKEGLDVELLAMRLEADLNEAMAGPSSPEGETA
jgi:hypothetical protein